MAKTRNVSEFPEITARIWGIVEKECGGNVKRFTTELGLDNGSKVQRLFVKDKRNQQYPTPSTDIVSSICRRFPEYGVSYIMFGNDDRKGTVNNINIAKADGDSNVIGDNNSVSSVNERLLAMMEQQQNQINTLFKLLAEKL